MGFYVSLMGIFDPKKSFMTRIIFVSFMDIYDQKKTVIHDKNNFVSFMNIYDQKKKFCIQ